ncbi:MAG: acyl-CoA dehydrogenase family protein [Pseudomonadota bacterium]
MEFGLSSDQRILVDSLRRFIDRELLPLEEKVELTGRLDPTSATDIFEKSRANGFYAMSMPAELGGGGLSTLDWIIAEEQFGRTTDILIRRAFGNIYDILLAATPEQQERWLVPCIHGERTCSIAFTEPEAGSDAGAVRTQATPDGDGWVLNGYKHYISDAHFSDFFVVTARTKDRDGRGGVSTFIVDKGLAGFQIGADQPMMGLRGTTHAPLTFDNVRLGSETLLGEQGGGFKLALKTLGRVRLAQVGARAIGKAAIVLEKTGQHARNRHQFGKPLAEFLAVQSMLAESAVEISSARLLLYQTAWLLDQGSDARAQIAMVKLQASELLNRVTDRAVQIHGGSGYSKELPIERYYRDARIYRIFDGVSDIQKQIVARNLRGDASDPYQIAV